MPSIDEIVCGIAADPPIALHCDLHIDLHYLIQICMPSKWTSSNKIAYYILRTKKKNKQTIITKWKDKAIRTITQGLAMRCIRNNMLYYINWTDKKATYFLRLTHKWMHPN